MVLFGLSILGITLFYLFYRSLDSNQKQTIGDIFDDICKTDDSAHTDADDSSHHAADFDDSSYYSCDDGGDDGGDGGD